MRKCPMRRLVAAVLAMLGLSVGAAQANSIDLVASGYYGFTQLPVQVDNTKGTLILSDSPEYVGEPGVTAAGTINGLGRVYFYHVNETKEPMKIGLTAQNKTFKRQTVTIHRELASKSTPDYFAAGRDLSQKDLEEPLFGNQYLDKKALKTKKHKGEQGQGAVRTINEGAVDLRKAIQPYSRKVPFGGLKPVVETFVLKPGEKKQIFTKLDNKKVKEEDLFTGMVDLTTTGDAFVETLALPYKAKVMDFVEGAKYLPIDDVRLRGTYVDGAFRTLSVPTVFDSNLGAAYVEVANDREDPFILGVDEMDHKALVKDAGNFGVSYHLTIKTQGTEPFRLYFNPQGGAYSGSFLVSTDNESKIYHVGDPYIGHQTILDTAYLGTYHGGDNLYIEFIPAGASNLPVKFLFIPEKQVREAAPVSLPVNTGDLSTQAGPATSETTGRQASVANSLATGASDGVDDHTVPVQLNL